jgi:hypothetical protein
MGRIVMRQLLLAQPLATTCASIKDQSALPKNRPRTLADAAPMRSLLMIAALIVIASLGACAFIRTDASWVDDLPENTAAPVAGIITGLVAQNIAPGGKPIMLTPLPLTQPNDALTAELALTLQAHGYRLVTDEAGAQDHHRLRYRITAWQGGYVLRLDLDGAETSTLLTAGPDGRLLANAPLLVRENTQ